MTLYGRNDLDRVAVASTGHLHERAVIAKATKTSEEQRSKDFVVSCAACEPELRQNPLFASHPKGVPLTPDELLERDSLRKSADVNMVEMFKAISELASERAAAKANRG